MKQRMFGLFASVLATALAGAAMAATGSGASAQPSVEANRKPTVLITGANRGIGLEFARQYAARDWRVIATARDPGAATDLNALAGKDPDVVVEKLDVVDHAAIDALATKYAGQPIEVLINNAGLMRGPDKGQTVGTIDYAEFDRFYRTNAMGPLKVSEAFFPHVKAGERKVMAALTTGTGKRGIPVPGFSLYKTSKAALNAIQQEIALRWQKQDIKVVTLMPGRVLTHGEPATPGQRAIPVQDSVAGMMRVIDNLTLAQTGHTIQWDGEQID